MTEIKELTIEETEALEQFLIQPERHEKNIDKLVEELFELGEVLMKYKNKKAENKPPVSKITEEVGDVFFRAAVVVRQLDIEEQVLDRLDEKTMQVYEYYQERIKEVV